MVAKRISKTDRVFAALLAGHKLTRFDAARYLHDTTLNSTVSDLQKSHGVVIARKLITVPGYQGNPTKCCLYWIERSEAQRYRARKKEALDTSDQTNEEGTQNEQA